MRSICHRCGRPRGRRVSARPPRRRRGSGDTAVNGYSAEQQTHDPGAGIERDLLEPVVPSPPPRDHRTSQLHDHRDLCPLSAEPHHTASSRELQVGSLPGSADEYGGRSMTVPRPRRRLASSSRDSRASCVSDPRTLQESPYCWTRDREYGRMRRTQRPPTRVARQTPWRPDHRAGLPPPGRRHRVPPQFRLQSSTAGGSPSRNPTETIALGDDHAQLSALPAAGCRAVSAAFNSETRTVHQ